ncbi:Ubiquitin-like-specific protease ESD4 [Vitis vinifera]|uniref:Ubiquitin-like-specific protease ESD4 n=1 Tax=Vitis vinifera TaxID=29760 RepID=A0A438GPC2_VITVI|nr:Ubiquitin-like-specific protease ESD4 [Vitis vinifera]
MATVRRKRKEHLPATCSQVKLPKSRCSGKKFISVIVRLPDDKRDAITEIGFGGLLHLACRELRYELCSWIISNYDTAYHQLNMATGVVVPVTAQDVGNIMGIPCGEEIVVHTRRGTSNRTYTISLLEQNLENLAIGDDFRKTFLIFACATLLAPNSKLEGMHDLWDTIWDGDLFYMTKFYLPSVTVDVTMPLLAAWSDDLIKRRLSAEIATFGGYGHVHTQQLPESAAHSHAQAAGGQSSASDDAIEVIQARMVENSEKLLRLASSLAEDVAELRSRQFGLQYRCSATPAQPLAQVQDEPAPTTGDIQLSVEEFVEQPNLPSAPHSPTERHESAFDHGPSSLHQESHDQSYPYPHLESVEDVQNVGTIATHSHLDIPTSSHKYKRTGRRIVKRPAICKSPFVAQCLKLFPKISHKDRLVADFALDEDADPSEVVCDMHGLFITRAELASLNGGRWVNNIIIGVTSCMLNANQPHPRRCHYFDPSFSVVLASLLPKARKEEILDRSRMFLQADIVGHDVASCEMLFIPVCENNHWHLHVLNIPAGRIEILSSLPLRRGNYISASTRRLSMALERALHAHGIHVNVEVSKLVHVQPDLVQQKNGYDCGIFALKYMEYWNGATLTQAVAKEKMHVYRLQMVVTLLLNEANNVRGNIIQACGL